MPLWFVFNERIIARQFIRPFTRQIIFFWKKEGKK